MNTAGNRCCKGAVRNILCAALCAALYAPASVALAQSAASGESIRQYDIPAGSLSSALGAWGAQSDRQVVFAPDLVVGKQTKGISGQYNAEQALTQLLAGTGLAWKRVNGQTYALEKAPPPQPANTKPKPASKSKSSSFAAAQKPTQLDTVSVTGTRIRGGVTASPTITIGAQEIQNEGFTDLGQVIRSVPQNFNGGQNPGIFNVPVGNNFNSTGGSALNLRGLGADASLTLLNGRRLAYDGSSQAVDISAIPVEAVERLEIAPDGASAIYGSDAVGGVANVILKRDYEGVTVGARYGGATEGGLATREYTVTGGAQWSSGGLIATYKDTSADPIYVHQRSYTRYLLEPYTIYNGSDARTGLVSVHQSMGNVAELRLDAFKTNRDTTRYAVVEAGSYYRFTPDTSIGFVAPSIEFFLHHDWSLTFGGTYGKDESVYAYDIVSAAGSSLVSSRTCDCNESRSWQLDAEGPLFPMGGGEARLAVGIGSQKNKFRVVPKESGSLYEGEQRDRFAYAELNLPFVSPYSGIPGVHRLEFSAAMRGEDYASFGRLSTPKFGVVYDPTADLTFKTSWGKSFKAPTLGQLYGTKFGFLYGASTVGASGSPADATALFSYGGNGDLHAERARSWTASLALHPEVLPGLDTELTWFAIDYADRVVSPITNFLQALSDPAYADFLIRSPTPEQIQELLASYTLTNLSGSVYDPSKVVAIIHDQYVNAARQRIKGLDLSGSYRFDLGGGQLTIRGSTSWLDSVQTTSAGQPEQTLAGIVFNPARLKARLGTVWTSGGFTASSFVNYTSGVTDSFAPLKKTTSSFTTLDLTLNYNTGERVGIFSGLTLGLSAQNLLNRAPPFSTAPYATTVAYDATNYSAIGRFISVSVSKRW